MREQALLLTVLTLCGALPAAALAQTKSVTVLTQTETLVLPRNEIDSIQQSELSMMPEGLLAPLSDQEVRDLIYYLGRTGQVPLPAEKEGN